MIFTKHPEAMRLGSAYPYTPSAHALDQGPPFLAYGGIWSSRSKGIKDKGSLHKKSIIFHNGISSSICRICVGTVYPHKQFLYSNTGFVSRVLRYSPVWQISPGQARGEGEGRQESGGFWPQHDAAGRPLGAHREARGGVRARPPDPSHGGRSVPLGSPATKGFRGTLSGALSW